MPLSPRIFVPAFAFALAAGPAAGAVTLEVQVGGVNGAHKLNVENLLSIRRYAGQAEISETRVRHLHALAPEEITRALEPFGYYHVQVDDSLRQQGDRWRASYHIELGDPVRVDTATILLQGEGVADSALRSVVDQFPVRVGDPLRHAAWELGKASLAGQAHVRGYLDGKFDSSSVVVDPGRGTAALHLVYDTGPRYAYGPVRFEQDALHQKYLDGYVPFEEGEPLDFGELRAFQNALRSTNYFQRVEVEPNREDAVGNRVPVDVRLEPSRPVKLDFGVSYGTDEGFGVMSGALMRRVNRRGHRADVQLKAAQAEQSAIVNYRVPWANPPTSVLSFSTGYEREDTESRLNETLLLATSFSHLRGPWHETLALVYRNETYEVGPDEGRTTLVGPDLEWSLVHADDRVFTRRGYRIRPGVEGSWSGAIASVSYAQVNLDAKWILGGKGGHRLIARGLAGHTLTDQFRELPSSVRYFSGGAQSIRGYGYESLAPRDAQGEPIGGESLLETGLEYDYRVLKSWAVAAFYDLGGALSSWSGPLSHGAGAGIRWLSPIGMVRLDYAWGLSRDGVPTEIHFMIGPDL